MRILPVALHAQRRIPALSSLFSDALSVTTIDVVAGGTTTLNFAADHGLNVGGSVAVSITDAQTPNLITAATVLADGNVSLTTQHPHDLTTTPDTARAKAWNTSAHLEGFGSSLIDGTKQLISVPDRNTLVIAPSGTVAGVTIDGGENLLERIEGALIGYHAVSVATTTTLTLTTPSSITRSYTITAPNVVTNMRCFGVASSETAVLQYVRSDNTPVPVTQAHLFVAPIDVKTSRSKGAQLDGLGEINEGTDYRQTMIDGFDVIVVLPAEDSVGGLTQADLAHGSIFSAVLGTFYGLQIPRPELKGLDPYVAIFKGHNLYRFDGANYMHRYSFEVLAELSNADAIAPYDWPDIDPDNINPTLFPMAPVPIRDIDFPTPEGIRHDGKPGTLTGTFELDDNP